MVLSKWFDMENGYHYVAFNFLPLFDMTNSAFASYIMLSINAENKKEEIEMTLFQWIFHDSHHKLASGTCFLHNISFMRPLFIQRYCSEYVFHLNDCSIFKTIETKGHI